VPTIITIPPIRGVTALWILLTLSGLSTIPLLVKYVISSGVATMLSDNDKKNIINNVI